MGTGSRLDVSLLGDRELTAIFNSLQRNVGARALRPALKKGAVPILNTARYLAPRLTGRMAGALSIKSSTRRGSLRVLVQTGTREAMGIPAKAEYFYPAVREFGVEGDQATPFLRPALEQRRQEAISVIATETWKRIEKLGLGQMPSE